MTIFYVWTSLVWSKVKNTIVDILSMLCDCSLV